MVSPLASQCLKLYSGNTLQYITILNITQILSMAIEKDSNFSSQCHHFRSNLQFSKIKKKTHSGACSRDRSQMIAQGFIHVRLITTQWYLCSLLHKEPIYVVINCCT